MHDLVAEGTNDKGGKRDYQNPSPAWEVTVDGMEKLRAYNDIDR